MKPKDRWGDNKYQNNDFLDDVDFALYNDAGVSRCPLCGSKDLSWGDIDWTSTGSDGEVNCNSCGARWIEGMRTVEVFILEIGQDEPKQEKD